MSAAKPRIALTAGDPRGIGPEVARAALESDELRRTARFVVVGPEGSLEGTSAERMTVGTWDPRDGDDEAKAGRVSGRAVEEAVRLALGGEVDGVVTAPISKAALSAAGYPYPGHSELLRDRCEVREVTMMMAAEATPLGGPLRMGLLTGHVALRDVPAVLTRELAIQRSRIAVGALRAWWGLDRPRIAFAGVNPHASEGGMLGDEEERVLGPAARALEEDDAAEVDGIHPADTVFRRCLQGDVDAVLVPYHDVGLAVLKTLALERGVNVTAGLPFPRTSPGHGTALDIAGRGVADPRSMIEAVRTCVRFCRAGRTAAGPAPAEAAP